MSVGTKMIHKPNWPIIAFFGVTSSIAIIGGPWYFMKYGISWDVAILTLFYTIATGVAITVGYHRLFSHVAFKANKFVQFLALFFGAAAFEQSTLTWSSGHRDHHRYVDTELDPYSIKKGFWYAHIGWMTLWQQQPDYNNVKDLMKNKMLMHQHYHYVAWGFVSGILLPVLIGVLTGHALGGLIFGVCVRMTFVYHATFCINSLCHSFGKATYDIHATAKDNWFAAILTNGEGYHNFHHRFPTDYRNGIRWYHWDPSKWVIVTLKRLGMIWDLQKVSKFSILEARWAAEHQLVQDQLVKRVKDQARLVKNKEVFHAHHAHLMQKLSAWKSSEMKAEAMERVHRTRDDFQLACRQWKALTGRSLQLVRS